MDIREVIKEKEGRPLYKDDPQFWWNIYGKDYFEDRFWTEPARDTETEPLYILVEEEKPIKTVLEVGCGFGRLLFPLNKIERLQKIVGWDFSTSQIEHAKKVMGCLEFSKIEFKTVSILEPDLEETYDLVFTHGCLSHVHPDKVLEALTNIVKLSNAWVVLIECGLHPEKEIKEREFKYCENGTFGDGAAGNNTWGYDWESICKPLFETVGVYKKFVKGNYGHTTLICKKKEK